MCGAGLTPTRLAICRNHWPAPRVRERWAARVGVEVTNGGRESFHVARWALRSEPGGISSTTLGVMTGSATIRTDIAPVPRRCYMDLNDAYALASAAKAVDGKPQRIVVTVESGGRVYTTKPIASANVALGAPSGEPGQLLP